MKHSVPFAQFVKPPAAYENGNEFADSVQTSLQSNDRGTIRNIRIGKLSRVIFSPKTVLESEAYGASARSLESSIGSATEKTADASERGATREYLTHEINTNFAAPVGHFRVYTADVRKEKQRHHERRANLLAVRPGNDAVRAVLANWFLAKPPIDKIKIALNSDYELAASIMTLGSVVSGLESEIWKQFEKHWMAVNHIKAAGTEADHPLMPSADNITVVGVDHAAVYADAKAKVAAFESEIKQLAQAENFAQSVLQALMMLTQKPASDFI